MTRSRVLELKEASKIMLFDARIFPATCIHCLNTCRMGTPNLSQPTELFNTSICGKVLSSPELKFVSSWCSLSTHCVLGMMFSASEVELLSLDEEPEKHSVSCSGSPRWRGGGQGCNPHNCFPWALLLLLGASQNCGATLLAVGGSKPGSPVLMPASLGRSQPTMGDSLWLVETSFYFILFF